MALQDRTRFEPAEVEPRIVERWLASGLFHPEPAGPDPRTARSRSRRRTSPARCTWATRSTARSRTRWSAGTGCTASARSGSSAPTTPASPPRRRSRGCCARRARAARSSAARRSSSASGSGASSTAARSSSSSSASARPATTSPSASRSTRATSGPCSRSSSRLYDKGLIYRDNYMVNWDPGSRSAISDLEVEEREVDDTLYYDRLPARRRLGRGRRSRPCGPRRCSPTPRSPCTRTTSATPHLVGRTVRLPLVGRELPVIADAYVKPEFGTGCLKITPGHDPNDFEIGRRHGLPEISVIGEDGRMTEAAGEAYAGLGVAGRPRARRGRRSAPAVRSVEAYPHTVPFSHRSGERIEPLISLQWFMRMDELAQAGDRRPSATGACASIPSPSAAATWLAREHPPVVHLAPAVVGPPDPRLVPRRRGPRRARRRREGRRLDAGPRRPGHLVLLGAVAVRDAGLARRDRRAAGLLPDRRALHGARHPLPVGRPHGDDGPRVHGRRARSATSTCTPSSRRRTGAG